MTNIKVATRLREIYEIPTNSINVNNMETVKEVVSELNTRYPGIINDLVEENGDVRPDVVIYLDGQPIESTNMNASVVGVGTVRIIQAMAGG